MSLNFDKWWYSFGAKEPVFEGCRHVVVEGKVKHTTIEPTIGKKDFYQCISLLWDEVIKRQDKNIKIVVEVDK